MAILIESLCTYSVVNLKALPSRSAFFISTLFTSQLLYEDRGNCKIWLIYQDYALQYFIEKIKITITRSTQYLVNMLRDC